MLSIYSRMLYILGDLQLYDIWTFQDDFHHQVLSIFLFGFYPHEAISFPP